MNRVFPSLAVAVLPPRDDARMDPDPRDGRQRRDTDQLLQTIRALLAKAEATPFPEEAKAFTDKAGQLMARHAIEESAVWAGTDAGRRGTPVEVRITLHRPYLSGKALLVHYVADACGCEAIRFGAVAGRPTEQVAVIGYESDCKFVEALVTSLLVQIATAIAATQPEGCTSAEASSWRRSFLAGFTEEVAARLRAERAEAAAAAEPVVVGERVTSMALVIADRRSEVRNETRRRYPQVRRSRVSVGSSQVGRSHGRVAGRKADLGHRRVASCRALGG